MSFNLSLFISESNLIDPQPSYDNSHIIPGAKPGDLMYDNMERSYLLALDKISGYTPLSANDVLDIHRELTRGVDFFEEQGMSGQWRRVNVMLRSKGQIITFAPVYLLHWLMNDVWAPFYQDCLNAAKTATDDEKAEMAYQIHDLFECIHPFIDGNGRTGRILLNTARQQFGLNPIVILYNNREAYYEKIQAFRLNEYDTIVSKYNKYEA